MCATTVNPCGDRISNLHESIISHILSRLPTRDAVRTCMLSKNWKYKWTCIYNVDLWLWRGTRISNLENMVERILLLTRNLKSFTLVLRRQLDLNLMKTLIYGVLGHKIEICKIFCDHQGFILPQTLLACTSLRDLELISGCILRVPGVNNFPNLTYLWLSDIEIVNGDPNTGKMILNFPALKKCRLHLCKWLNVTYVEIHAPSLTTFGSISYEIGRVNDYTIHILGARLAKFETSGDLDDNYVLTGSTIDNAVLSNCSVHSSQVRKLMKELSTVKHLKLSGKMVQVIVQSLREIHLPMFDNLERLDISLFYAREGLDFLRSTPFLKFLELDVRLCDWDDYEYYNVKSVPSCIVSYLEEVKLRCCADRKHKFRLEKFLLKNGTRLKKVSVYVKPDLRKDEFAKQLSTFPKASTCLTTEALSCTCLFCRKRICQRLTTLR